MPREEADAWVQGSAFQRPVYHVTERGNSDAIKRDGFDLARGGQGFGSLWGLGVYATDSSAARRVYARSLRDAVDLELRVQARRVLQVDLGGIRSNETAKDHILRSLPGGRARLSSRVTEIERRNQSILDEANRRYPVTLRGLFSNQFLADRQAFLDVEGYIERPEAVAFPEVMQQYEYDVLDIVDEPFRATVGGSQVIVFDPRRVVVIDE